MIPDEISLQEMRDQWPKDASGLLCVRLLKRYLFSKLVETSANNDCNAVSAQGEAAAGKALAQMVKDFGSIISKEKDEPNRTPLQPLNRFREQPSTTVEK